MMISRTLISILLSGALASVTACKKTEPLFCDEDTPCDDPARPFCDVNGQYPASEGVGNTCIPDPFGDAGAAPDATPDAGPPCDSPGAFLRCDSDAAVMCSESGNEERTICEHGCNAAAERCNECVPDSEACTNDEYVTCAADGTIAESHDCPLGCHDSEARCNDIAPSNDLGQYLDLTTGTPAVVLPDATRIDTTSGEVTHSTEGTIAIPSYTMPAPTDGVPVRVLVLSSLTTEGRVLVTGDRALAIVADKSISIGGTFSVRGGEHEPGPGSITSLSAPCVGRRGAVDNAIPDDQASGSGGGGHRTAGGNGGEVLFGDPIYDLAGGEGGAAFPNDDLIPLRGGCAGDDGYGGGAVQFVSRTGIEIQAGAHITANGMSGIATSQELTPTPSGGSGGGILLEAPTVSIGSEGGLVAKGGGGACFQYYGEWPTFSEDPTLGGECNCDSTQLCLDGGDGGAKDIPPTDGEGTSASSPSNRYGGGGGGAAGYIRINTSEGTFTIANDAIISPEVGTGVVGKR